MIGNLHVFILILKKKKFFKPIHFLLLPSFFFALRIMLYLQKRRGIRLRANLSRSAESPAPEPAAAYYRHAFPLRRLLAPATALSLIAVFELFGEMATKYNEKRTK